MVKWYHCFNLCRHHAMIWYHHGAATTSSQPIIAFALIHPPPPSIVCLSDSSSSFLFHQPHYKSKDPPHGKAETMFSAELRSSNTSSFKNGLWWKVPNHEVFNIVGHIFTFFSASLSNYVFSERHFPYIALIKCTRKMMIKMEPSGVLQKNLVLNLFLLLPLCFSLRFE